MRYRLSFLAAIFIACSANAIAAQPEACVLITNFNQLQAMRDNMSGSYCLGNDIDAGTKANFTPVGNAVDGLFTGQLNGRGFTIRNLTIKSATLSQVGLFGITDGAVITDLRLENIRVRGDAINGAAGGLVGMIDGNNGAGTVRNVHVSGLISCTGSNCSAGGITGALLGTGVITSSSSSATVEGVKNVGGLAGFLNSTITRSYATGFVTCVGGMDCIAGGLGGRSQHGAVSLSFAAAVVTGSDGGDSRTGGLIALTEVGTTVTKSFAAGEVIAGSAGIAAGLIGQHNSGGDVDQVYSVSRVMGSGATLGGLIVSAGGMPTITNAYWDTETSGQMTSVAGSTGLTTAQLRANLPAGFLTTVWGITETLSYPFLLDNKIDLKSPLATLVQFQMPYVFLPIRQADDWEYETVPTHSDAASLAAVYTMIARGIGIAVGNAKLDDVKIDKYFWDDATQTTTWRGPVKTFARLGPVTGIPDAEPLKTMNVIRQMNAGRLVILRGTYTKTEGGTAHHWMLGTLYTRDAGNALDVVIAHDPFTGQQVEIDPATKGVVSPAGFPLANFKIDRYQRVTLQLPISDRRLKRDVVEVARLDNGLGLYRYRYKASRTLYVGVMAQEVAKIRPDAVAVGPDGFLRVNYARLGMQLQTWKEWRKAAEHRSPGKQRSASLGH